MPKKTTIDIDAEHEAPHNWGALLDELRLKESIESDAKLAETLGVTRGYISLIRKGKKGLSLRLAEDVLSRLGQTFETEKLEELFIPAKVHTRSKNLQKIRHFIVERAKGHCQLCKNPAPFKDAAGRPFLKVHLIVPFREGGTETPDNLVVLCSNCYDKMKFNPTEADKKKLKAITEKY